jgi:hypothetical protein
MHDQASRASGSSLRSFQALAGHALWKLVDVYHRAARFVVGAGWPRRCHPKDEQAGAEQGPGQGQSAAAAAVPAPCRPCRRGAARRSPGDHAVLWSSGWKHNGVAARTTARKARSMIQAQEDNPVHVFSCATYRRRLLRESLTTAPWMPPDAADACRWAGKRLVGGRKLSFQLIIRQHHSGRRCAAIWSKNAPRRVIQARRKPGEPPAILLYHVSFDAGGDAARRSECATKWRAMPFK